MRQFVQEAAEALQIDPTATPDVILAVNEMVTNIIIHGYQGQPGMIDIEIYGQGRHLVICLRDQAPPFDPTAAPNPDLTLPLAMRPLGKMGIFLTRKLMDQMTHRVTAQGGNELILTKKCLHNS
jgi:anti-sigma regulatory factor (Ser/Thr protein kinase)